MQAAQCFTQGSQRQTGIEIGNASAEMPASQALRMLHAQVESAAAHGAAIFRRRMCCVGLSDSPQLAITPIRLRELSMAKTAPALSGINFCAYAPNTS